MSESKKIVFSDRMKVKATKKARNMKEGEVYSLHPVNAEKLIKKGVAEKVK